MSGEYLKKFKELSEVAQWHLLPKWFGEGVDTPGQVYTDDKVRKWLYEMEKMENSKEEVELRTTSGKHLLAMMEAVDKIHLISDFAADEKEQEKLLNCKLKLREMIVTVLNSIREYILSIFELEQCAGNSDVMEIQNKDKARRFKHNKLIDDIKSLNRSMHWWIGKFDPDQIANPKTREMYDKQEPKYISDKIERIDVPENGICPPSINLADRYQITIWAEQIFRDVTYLEKQTRD